MFKLYFWVLLSSFLGTILATPISVWLAEKYGVLDPVDPRKIHQRPTPRWGGIGIIFGFIIGLCTLWLFFPQFRSLLGFSQGILRSGKVLFTLNLGEQFAGILFGVILLFIVGLVDDRKPMPAGMKFLFQIIGAYVAMTYGVRIYGLSVPGFEAYSHFPLWLMQIITLLWLVGMTNAVNLIDGLDGLAAGVVAIVAGSFLAVTLIQDRGLSMLYENQMKLAGMVSAALFGGVAGFLIYNFFPATVFMGDGGSLSLGFLIGCVAVIGTFKTTFLVVLIVPFLLVVVPAADMAVAFGRRLLNKQSPFAPDRKHFHHRLIDQGWTQREVVLLVYVITLIFAFISIVAVAIKNSHLGRTQF